MVRFIVKCITILILLINVLIGCTKAPTQIFFDDFNYSNAYDEKISLNGWSVRKSRGGPGVTGATWSKDAVTFITENDNTIIQLSAYTNGNKKETIHSEIVHKRKFFEGTYATRMYYTDEPIIGPDKDEVVQAFFTINSLRQPMDPDYSEVDFEYLPNGAWGDDGPRLSFTTWETYKPTPWKMVAITDSIEQSFEGWHTYMVTVHRKKVKYYVDGELKAVHKDEYYPEKEMSINFNIWFTKKGLGDVTDDRTYIQQMDWVLYVKEKALKPEEIGHYIDNFRSNSIKFKDTVE